MNLTVYQQSTGFSFEVYMGLFNLFSSNKGDSPAIEDLTKAQEQYDRGEYLEALRTLGWGFQKDVNYKPLYRLAVDSMTHLEAGDEQELFESALNNFRDVVPFYNLGNHFGNVGHYRLSQAFLERAFSLAPLNVDVAHDLAVAYARSFQVRKAAETLSSVDVSGDFWSSYFLMRCMILIEDVEGLDEALQYWNSVLDEEESGEGVEIARMKLNEIAEMLSRFRAVGKPEHHIRDWHFIQYGGVVLDYFDDSEEYVAGGRYVALWGTHDSLKSITGKLRTFVTALSVDITRILALPDRDSEIVGRVIAAELGIGFGFYESAIGTEQCLIIAGSTSSFNDHEELLRIKHGQIVFALNHDWLSSSVVAPDIIGFMAQSYFFPWAGGGMRVIDIESRQIERAEPDDRSAEEIANDIAGMNVEKEDITSLTAFYYQHRELLKGIGGDTGVHRYSFMIDSPVPGSYFA